VPAVGPGQREFAQLMADHILCHQDRNVLTTVVNGNRQANHFWQYHGPARPGFDWALAVAGYRIVDLLNKMMVYKRAFFD